MADKTENVLRIEMDPKKSEAQQFAELGMEGLAPNASIANAWLGDMGMDAKGALTECVDALRETVGKVRGGDLGYAETLLVGQAAALNSLFVNMVGSAGLTRGINPQAFERYMRLALKAQSQCRCTLETLAEIKNPRQVAFVRQANIANGHQQINNGETIYPDPAGGETAFPQNKLLEAATYGNGLDTRAAGQAIRSNPPLEAVGTVHRPAKRRRKAAGQP